MKRLLIALLFLLTFLLGITGFVIGTESGLAFALGRLHQWAPDVLEIESANGKLIGPLQVRGFSLQAANLSLSINRLELEWSPALIFSGTLKVDKLHVEGVNYQSLTPAAENTKAEQETVFTLPERLPIPLSTELKGIRFSNISLILAAGEEPVDIQRIQLVVNYSKPEDQISDSSLTIASEVIDAKLELSAATADQYEFSGRIDWQLKLPELADMTGNVRLNGNTKTVNIETALQAPYSINAVVDISDPVSNPALNGTINLAIQDTAKIKSDIPALGIDGLITADGSPSDLIIASSISLKGLIAQTVFAEINSRLQNQVLTLDDTQVTLENHPIKVHLNGTLDSGRAREDSEKEVPLVDLAIDWTQLSWPLDAEPLFDSPKGAISIKGSARDLALQLESLIGTGEFNASGRLQGQKLNAEVNWYDLQWPNDGSQATNINGQFTIQGTLSDYLLAVTTSAETTAAAGVHLMAAGQGSQQSLQLKKLSLAALDGELQGRGEVTWSPELNFNVRLEGKQFNPATLAEQLPGSIDLRVSASGHQNHNIFAVALNELTMEGRLRDLPFILKTQGDGKISQENGLTINLDNLQLTSGPTRFQAKGEIGDPLNINWSFNSPDLSTLWPTASGEVHGQGMLLGSKQFPAIDMKLDASKLKFEGYSLQSLALKANAETAPRGKLMVNMNLSEAMSDGLSISEFSITSSGKIDDHRIKLRGRSNQGGIDADLLGSLANEQWSWHLLATQLAYPQLPPWTLREAAKGRISGDSFTMEDTCLVSGTASLCAQANKSLEKLQASYQLRSLPLAYFRPLLPEHLELTGLLESSGSADQALKNSLFANISLRLNKGGLDVSGPEEKTVRIVNIDPAVIESNLGPDGLHAKAELDFGNQGKLESYLAIAGPPDNLTEGVLSGAVSGSLTDISFIEELLPELTELGGRIVSDLHFSGSLSQPVIDGSLAFTEGKADLTTPGLSLQNVTATLSGAGGKKLAIDTDISSGPGSATVRGTIDLATEPVSLAANITGKRFEVINTREAQVAISPQLDINYRDNRLQINGDITLPILHITPRKLPAGTAQASEDQVFVEPKGEPINTSPLDVLANLRIIMGDDVLIDAFGLRTSLSGALTVNETPGQETTASGQLNTIDGSYKAYGQNLKIRKGRIIYVGGPVSKPGFDIDAIREINTNLLVGVRARGALSQPEFNLFSEPPLPESEQMSYLLFGRPLEDNSPGEQSAVRQAAMALGVAGGTFLTERFGDRLGLDEVRIDSELRESGEQAALVVGKYLSPKLFVSYGLGLFEPVTALRLRYSISKNVKLVTETTESEEGGDLIFTFESEE